mmetsp:Transcript_12591/g.20023  ORF Transcript_12591/g.20023 Transcript_12591/m.20023 type:complete len:290 (-) Transcript_12591:158-1027(-)
MLRSRLDVSKTTKIAGGRNSSNSSLSSLWHCRHGVRVVVGNERHSKPETALTSFVEMLRVLTHFLKVRGSPTADVVDGITDQTPRDSLVEHASRYAFLTVTALLDAALALLLALIGATRKAGLAIAGHARSVIESHSLVLASTHAGVVAKVVTKPACTLAGVDVARGGTNGVVADEITRFHLVAVLWNIFGICNHPSLASTWGGGAFRLLSTTATIGRRSSRGRRSVRVRGGGDWRGRRRRRNRVIEHGKTGGRSSAGTKCDTGTNYDSARDGQSDALGAGKSKGVQER